MKHAALVAVDLTVHCRGQDELVLSSSCGACEYATSLSTGTTALEQLSEG